MGQTGVFSVPGSGPEFIVGVLALASRAGELRGPSVRNSSRSGSHDRSEPHAVAEPIGGLADFVERNLTGDHRIELDPTPTDQFHDPRIVPWSTAERPGDAELEEHDSVRGEDYWLAAVSDET